LPAPRMSRSCEASWKPAPSVSSDCSTLSRRSACGVRRDDLARLAEEAAGQWTAGFNPRPVAKEDFVRLYEAAFG